MAIICTLEKKRTDNRYYARSRKTGRVGFAQFAEEISRNCTAKPSDVTLVLTELCDVMRHHLLDGEEITIPDLGSFHIGIQSDSVENPQDFSPTVTSMPSTSSSAPPPTATPPPGNSPAPC